MVSEQNGNINESTRIPITNLPSFNNNWDWNSMRPNSLKALIGGTQEAEVHLLTFRVDPVKRIYQATLKFVVKDDFGVSRNDALKFYNSIVPFTKGIRAMWILQHRRNYKPFVTVISKAYSISGSY